MRRRKIGAIELSIPLLLIDYSKRAEDLKKNPEKYLEILDLFIEELNLI